MRVRVCVFSVIVYMTINTCVLKDCVCVVCIYLTLVCVCVCVCVWMLVCSARQTRPYCTMLVCVSFCITSVLHFSCARCFAGRKGRGQAGGLWSWRGPNTAQVSTNTKERVCGFLSINHKGKGLEYHSQGKGSGVSITKERVWNINHKGKGLWILECQGVRFECLHSSVCMLP